jgi:hypothetical protein
MVIATAALGLVIGLVIGGLGGGGGALTVPALVYLLGLTAQDATSTEECVDTPHPSPPPGRATGTVVGTLLGRRVADRLSGATLTRIFALLLLLVGIFVGTESLLAG